MVSVCVYLGRDPVDEPLVDLGQHEEIKAHDQSAAAHERRRERKNLHSHSHGVVILSAAAFFCLFVEVIESDPRHPALSKDVHETISSKKRMSQGCEKVCRAYLVLELDGDGAAEAGRNEQAQPVHPVLVLLLLCSPAKFPSAFVGEKFRANGEGLFT